MLTRRHALLAPAVLLGAAERIPVAAVPISRMETPWWRRRFEAKQTEMRSRPVDLVWYGDSITENWERTGSPGYLDFAPAWQHYYGDRNALNLGFKGDATSHLLWRLRNGEAEGIQPRAAVVLIGANNLGLVHWDAEQTLAGIAAVLAELRSRLPRTRVLLLPVLPSIRSAWVTKQTTRIDQGIVEHFAEQDGNVVYVDVTGLFLRDGKADASQFYDPLLDPPEPALHPTAQAQARVADAIEPTLARLLGDQPKAPFAAR
ncbi:MAG: GDSL-type esterase/lipase family protein [Pseudomonadota bacterium]|nr:GDSL-type esterase/lipase family protein [Pseudomonadota bacterium]